MTPKKRPAESDEMTMQTRKAARFSYSELDEDLGLHFLVFINMLLKDQLFSHGSVPYII